MDRSAKSAGWVSQLDTRRGPISSVLGQVCAGWQVNSDYQSYLAVDYRFRAKRERLEWCQGLLPESQGQNLALTVLSAPFSFVSGPWIAMSSLHPKFGCNITES